MVCPYRFSNRPAPATKELHCEVHRNSASISTLLSSEVTGKWPGKNGGVSIGWDDNIGAAWSCHVYASVYGRIQHIQPLHVNKDKQTLPDA